MPDPQAAPVHVSSLQLDILRHIIRRTISAQRLVKRAQIILQRLVKSLSHCVAWSYLIQLEMSGNIGKTKVAETAHAKSWVAKFETSPPSFAIRRRVYDTFAIGVAIYHSLPNGSFTPAIRSPWERTVGCINTDAPASMAR